MDVEALKQKILDLAIRGKLVPQDPNDEPASVLIEKIKEEKAKLVKEGKIKASKEESYIYKGSDNCYYEKIGNKTIDINDEIPFENPNGWEWARLDTIANLIKAGGDCPTNFTKDKTEKNIVPIFSNGIENNGLYGYTDTATIIDKSVTISARGTIGFACVRNEPYVPIVRLITIVPDLNISLDYLALFLNATNETGSGTSTLQLTVPSIKTKLIAIPSLNEQKRISSKLSLLNKQLLEINDNHKSVIELVNIAKSKILEEIFGENSSYKSYYEKTVKFSELFNTISTAGIEIKTRNVLPSGMIPVVSQSQHLIDGYVNFDERSIDNLPVVVFGDHTRKVKYIDFKFYPGADGTKVLKAKKMDDKFFYYCTLYASEAIDNNGYARHFSKLKEVSINLPNLETQRRLANYLDTSFSILNSIL